MTGVQTCALPIYHLLDNGIPAKNILHLNLEDPAFKGLSVFHLYEKYLELMNPDGTVYLMLDEIQEVTEWQRDLRKLYDGPRQVRFVITGSNSSLLKGEYASLLTGRTLLCEVYPFSFKEFLAARGWDKGFERHILLADKPRLLHLFAEYLQEGGFPEVVREQNPKIKTMLLKDYYNSILTRDVLRRYPVRHAARYEAAAHYLVSNPTSPFSAKKLSPSIGITQHTMEEYLGYLEDVYLFFTLKHFSYSLKQQLTHPRKVYCIDNGLIRSVSFRFSDDYGKLLENLVLAQLRRWGRECYYWKGKKECDVVVMEQGKVTTAIQVSADPVDPKTRKREFDGLLEAMGEFGLTDGYILTKDEFETVAVDGKEIRLIPVWYWLLS